MPNLPAKPGLRREGTPSGPEIHPGSWWRLVNEDHALATAPAPDHGLVLLVRDVNVIDGSIHSVEFEAHPLWTAGRASIRTRYMIEDFLCSFAPEPEGAALREAEIAAVMAEVETLTAEMQKPPEAGLLLERQKEAAATSAADGPAAEPLREDPDSGPTVPAKSTTVPAVLLPSGDVAAAQREAETRIAALKAQQAWIAGKVEEMSGRMKLVSLYQEEKVAGTLASIKEETDRATHLLESVKTMRLFLGEDCIVETLLDGEGADPSEPLTFLQRMLYLDEEIILNDLLKGFSCAQMGHLEEILARDFSLVERMLPYPRSVVLARVRRNSREILDPEGLYRISDIFEHIACDLADKRIHVLIRDGGRVHMVTVDSQTSGAARLFPSRTEIDALFTQRDWSERGKVRAITPDMLDYADARDAHDQRALFYKRFLILFWGFHEREGLFGPFMPGGLNWLEESTHSEYFRFVHDEENVIEDGRPPVRDFVKAANARLRNGSRAVVRWTKAASPDTAPGLCVWTRDRVDFGQNEFAEPISLVEVIAEGAALKARASCTRPDRRDPSADRAFTAKVTLLSPPSLRMRRAIYTPSVSNGVLCLDGVTIADLEYYMTSRAARAEYLEYHHLMKKAWEVLKAEAGISGPVVRKIAEIAACPDLARIARALELWRSANRWGWPENDKDRLAVAKIANRLGEVPAIGAFLAEAGALRGGVKVNGDIWGVFADPEAVLADGTPMPWITEATWRGPAATGPRSTRRISWSEQVPIGLLETWSDPDALASFLDDLAPQRTETSRRYGPERTETSRGWRVPHGLYDAKNAKILERVATDTRACRDFKPVLLEKDPAAIENWVDMTFDGYKTSGKNHIVQLPDFYAWFGLAHATTETDEMPLSWLIGIRVSMDRFGWNNGARAKVMERINRLYANPARIQERLGAGATRSGVTFITTRLTLEDPLHRRWVDGARCTTSLPPSLADKNHKIAIDPRIGWRDAMAQRLVEPDKTEQYTRIISAESLLRGAGRITIVAPPEASAILDTAWDLSERSW